MRSNSSNSNISHSSSINNGNSNINNYIETFEGIRKNKSRKIFGILLILIIIDLGLDFID